MSAILEFKCFSKIPRLSRDCIITEKIDGTNACICIAEDLQPITLKSGRVMPFLVGSRTRWIQPENDNYGFAAWAYNNVDELLKLGKGTHFGEWWGKGIQRGYDLIAKQFSLFNVHRWSDDSIRPKCCNVVPVLYTGMFETSAINNVIYDLKAKGSHASPGFMNPEGIVIYHVAGGYSFKKTIEKDESPKRQPK